MKRLFRLPLTRRGVRRDIDDELAFHVEGRIDDFVARGMTREDAEREAVRRFGDGTTVRSELQHLDESARERRAAREWMGDLQRDVRFALRALVTRPGYAASVVVTLALGIGANTAIFSVADALLFRPPPYRRPARLVSVWSNMSAGVLFGIRDHARSFSQFATYSGWQMNVGDDATAVRAEGMDVSENLFTTLGVSPARGRDFSPGANKPGSPREAILSDAFWRAQFGGDTGLVGRTILVEGVRFTIVGIMPPSFYFPTVATQLWIQSTFDPTNAGNYWGWYKYHALARLRAGASLAQAERDAKAAAHLMRRENPLWDAGPTFGDDATVVPLQSEIAGPARTTLLVLLGVVLALLLIACANVANLVLVRSIGRAREFAVRTALGCSGARLTRQLLTENLVLAGIGGAVGIVLAWAGVHALVTGLPAQIGGTAPVAVDRRVLLFTAALTASCGIAFGLLPAQRAARHDPGAALAARGGSANVEHRRLAGGLTALQLALAVVLVAASGLLLRSFDALRRVDPGFRGDRVIAGRVTLSIGSYREPARRAAFLDALLARLESAAGITAVAAIDRPPLRGPVYGMAVRVEGQYEDARHELPMIEHEQHITPRYFETMSIPIARGRPFTSADRAHAPPVAIVSESVARHFWPDEDAVGKRISPPADTSTWITIVGVAREVKQDSVNGTNEMTIYRPLAQLPETDLTIVARTAGEATAFASTLRAAVAALDPTAPVTDVRTMGEIVSSSVARARFTALLLTGFALLALGLGAVGIYGVVSFTVAQRTRELGVRMALGASPRQVFREVLTRGAVLAGAGIGIGLTATFAVARVFAGLLYGVTALDGLTLVAAPALLFGVAVGAIWMPARRAVRTDPLTALRSD